MAFEIAKQKNCEVKGISLGVTKLIIVKKGKRTRHG